MKLQSKYSLTAIKTLSIYLYFIPIFVLLNSCFSNCNEINLSSDDKTWIKCYTNIDTLVFTSNLSKIDTFVITERYNEYTTCSKFELGPDVYNNMGVDYSQKTNSKEYDKHIYLGINNDFQHGIGKECIKSFQVYDLHASFDSFNKKDLKIKWVDLPALSKHRIKLMFFEKGDQFSNTAVSIQSFYWSKKYGLIQYELTTGEIFSLSKRK